MKTPAPRTLLTQTLLTRARLTRTRPTRTILPRALALATLALALAGCGNTSGSTPGASAVTTAPLSLAGRLGMSSLRRPLYLPDPATLTRDAVDRSEAEVIVGSSDPGAVERLAAHLGATVAGRIPELNASLLRLPPSLSGRKLALALGSQPGGPVRFALENRHDRRLAPVRPQTAAAQGLRPQGVTLRDSDPLSVKQWWVQRVGADQVRGLATGKGVTVAVVDSDFDRLHEDLRADGKIVTGLDTSDVSKELLLGPSDPLTNGSHGSGSAGIIAERGGNGVGGVGVAPDAVLMPIRIFKPEPVGDFNVAYGLVWAVNHGAKVLNNSWGGGGYTQIIKDALDYALMRGVVVVGSAGNDNRDLHSGPEAFPGVISVGASAGDDLKADFSVQGSRVDLYAPGDQGLTTEVDEGLTSPARESSYGLFNGTSMAGPVVSGGAALVLDRAGQLGLKLTPYQVKRLLSDSGDLMPDPRTPGARRLNLPRALNFSAGTLPADGGYLGVEVSDLVTGLPIDGDSVILTPLGGQNKGQDYLALTSNGGLGTDDKGQVRQLFGDPADDPSGVAYFWGVEPGKYEVRVAGPSIFSYDGSRSALLGGLTVGSGPGNAGLLRVQHQVDFFEYNARGERNGAPASASDLDPLAGLLSDPAGPPLLGGTFDSAYLAPAFPAAPAGTRDQDYYRLTVPAGKTLGVVSYGSRVGSLATPRIELVDAQGRPLAGATSVAAADGDPDKADWRAQYKAATTTTVYLKLDNAGSGEGLGCWYGMQISLK